MTLSLGDIMCQALVDWGLTTWEGDDERQRLAALKQLREGEVKG